jgi:anti-sigma factor RsiW
MGNPHCKWVRDRLPLLAGGELLGLDRRRVERHLIGCPNCRRHGAVLANALDVLHAVREETPSPSNAASVWPDVARMISQSRRPAETWSFAWPVFGLRPAFGMGLAFGLLVAGLGVMAARHQVDDANARMSTAALPLAPIVVQDDSVAPVITAESGHESARSASETPVAENTPPPKLDYFLDRAVPMGPDGRDGKQPTY